MSPFYKGADERGRPEAPVELPPSRRGSADDPANYIPGQGLVDAVNTALLLGKPLLLTGEPGTGKTQLADSVAWQLGYGKPLRFQAKSTSRARDLFYAFDSLGRFQAGDAASGDPLHWITFNALGMALLRAASPEAVAKALPAHPGQSRSIVLIDEVDKAPRDFPNDILAELEEMHFRIPELGGFAVRADPGFAPVVIITSNSEKNLPDAFLRRCIYYDIPFPDETALKRILAARLADLKLDDEFVKDALEVFHKLRGERPPLDKRPATAELLDWLTAMRRKHPESTNPLQEDPQLARGMLSTLAKSNSDTDRAKRIVDAWIQGR